MPYSPLPPPWPLFLCVTPWPCIFPHFFVTSDTSSVSLCNPFSSAFDFFPRAPVNPLWWVCLSGKMYMDSFRCLFRFFLLISSNFWWQLLVFSFGFIWISGYFYKDKLDPGCCPPPRSFPLLRLPQVTLFMVIFFFIDYSGQAHVTMIWWGHCEPLFPCPFPFVINYS